MKPRIYTYKITFPNQGWWYWGYHKERKFGEGYSGSPVTHKEKWDWFEWEIQILEFFDCEIEAQRVENRLIKPDLNNPKCLNECYGSVISTESCSKGGKVGGKIGGKVAVESGQLASIRTPESSSKGGKSGNKEGKARGGKIGGKISSKNTNSQQWKCLVTGETLRPGPLTHYQNKRGIDTNLRVRIK